MCLNNKRDWLIRSSKAYTLEIKNILCSYTEAVHGQQQIAEHYIYPPALAKQTLMFGMTLNRPSLSAQRDSRKHNIKVFSRLTHGTCWNKRMSGRITENEIKLHLHMLYRLLKPAKFDNLKFISTILKLVTILHQQSSFHSSRQC